MKESRTICRKYRCIAALCAVAFSLPANADSGSVPSMQLSIAEPGSEQLSVDSYDDGFQPPDIDGRLQVQLQQANGQDAEQIRRDTAEAQVELRLDLRQDLGPSARFAARMEVGSRRYSEEILNNADDDLSFDLQRLYIQYRLAENFRLRAGRQPFSDPMETVVDEDLDGIRLTYAEDSFELDLSLTREDWFEASTTRREDEVVNALISATYKVNGSEWLSYLLHRRTEPFDDARPADENWLGLQGIVEPSDSSFRYWLHGAVRDGKQNAGDTTRDLGGYAVGFGVNWKTGGRMKPRFTIAMAQASGGGRADRFRQSGLHSNEFDLNDKNTFRFMGEVADPELTNLRILTIGVGLTLHKDVALDIAFHGYRQVELEENSMRGSNIEYEALGLSDDLGAAADLVLGYAPNKKVEIKAIAGVFNPGKAFDGPDNDNQPRAWLASVEIEYRFPVSR